MRVFSSPLSMSIGRGVFLQPVSISIWVAVSPVFGSRGVSGFFALGALSFCNAGIIGVNSVSRRLSPFFGSVDCCPIVGGAGDVMVAVGAWSVSGGCGQHILLLLFGCLAFNCMRTASVMGEVPLDSSDAIACEYSPTLTRSFALSYFLWRAFSNSIGSRGLTWVWLGFSV